ncbi:MAG TPA: queuosine salvage family protein [Myxococcota bacterium]|nr:queuosine salvage family protein [Myxococcota bacterium]
MRSGILAEVRHAASRVMERARWVSIDERALAALARSNELLSAPRVLDPIARCEGAPAHKAAFVLTLDAINFGSGYFPHLAKRPGLSGYLTLSNALLEQWQRDGAWSARQLVALSPRDCARVFAQDVRVPEVAELMSLFAQALNELGAFLLARFAGDPTALIEAADCSAERLVGILSEMPLYRDVSRYAGFEVPFYKRAQLTCADLATAFAGVGYGAFFDLDRLTMFADNLVPHVLRCEGVLVYESGLAARIDAEQLLQAGSAEEVEIRAAAVCAVERCVALLRAAGIEISARELDTALWARGQLPEIKAHPRHRTRTTNY